ncbi:MAG: hypothetical protein WDZ49_03010 [Litorilinea sp.]
MAKLEPLATFVPTEANRHIAVLEVAELEKQAAQAIALQDEQVIAFAHTVDSQDDNAMPLRTQVFGIWPVLPGDVTEQTADCRTEGRCYRVELYNFAYNQSLVVWVNLEIQSVIYTAGLPDTSPELPPALTERAVEIALAAPEVTAELGFTPDAGKAVMANIKTALNNTTCERSRHLCVAPTFIVGQAALWAIVDLTDERLVGVRWTDVGGVGTTMVTQQTLEYETVFEHYCQQTTHWVQDSWSMDYVLTSSDGLLLTAVRFEDAPVLESIKLVDWHVSYSGTDGFGYNDAVGCPIFSQAAVGAYAAPYVETITSADGEVAGFALIQDYAHPNWPMPCNYRYQQRYEFYRDGRFRVAAANLGRGCGNHGIYRPVFRIHLAAPADGYTFEEWDGTAWQTWEDEGWQLQEQETPYTPEGFQYRIMDGQGRGYGLIPGTGQFGDGGRGDHAYVYVTRYTQGEGDMNLVTIGPCCNTDHLQGPEKFINEPPEPIRGENIVLWYVAQMENDSVPGSEYCWADVVVEEGVFVPRVWPCMAGPLFVPSQGDSP